MSDNSKVSITALEISGESEDTIRVTFDMPRIVGMPFREMGMDFHALTVEELADLIAECEALEEAAKAVVRIHGEDVSGVRWKAADAIRALKP